VPAFEQEFARLASNYARVTSVSRAKKLSSTCTNIRDDGQFVLADQAQIAPIRDGHDQRNDVGERVKDVDPAHQRIGEPFALGRRVSEHVPVHLIGKKPNFRRDQNDHGNDPRAHTDVDRQR